MPRSVGVSPRSLSEVAQVVQQRRAHQLRRRALALGEVRALQRVLELRHALALVGARALWLSKRPDDLIDYQGSE